MTRQQFWQGMGFGVLAGTIVGMAIQPKKHSVKAKANKAMRAVGGMMDDISDSLGK